MSMAQATHRVLEKLENALDTGHVPDEEKRRAAQLLLRLKSPVQVVVIGRPEAGKSRLINMLTGQSIIPDTASLPPLEVTFGPQPRTVYLIADGSEQSLDGLHLDQPVPRDTAIVRAELPLPILNRLSLTELTLTGSPSEQKAVVDWGLSRANIVLWCSQSFDAGERALWAPAPDVLKDHSFLVLTKADQLQMKGTLSERISQLEEVVAEEFFRMYPVATIQGISSGGADGVRDHDVWNSSGGKALVDAVERLVETGQNADTDNALVFLNRFASAPLVSPRKPVEPPDDGPAKPAEKQPLPGGSPGTAISKTTVHVAKQALAFLQQRADLMLSLAAENRPDKEAFILDHCLETANELTEIMMQAEQPDPSLSDIQEDVMECSDMMVLFHLEKTEDAAVDAVTLLLQIKKEMSVAVAG